MVAHGLERICCDFVVCGTLSTSYLCPVQYLVVKAVRLGVRINNNQYAPRAKVGDIHNSHDRARAHDVVLWYVVVQETSNSTPAFVMPLGKRSNACALPGILSPQLADEPLRARHIAPGGRTIPAEIPLLLRLPVGGSSITFSVGTIAIRTAPARHIRSFLFSWYLQE